MADRGIKSLAGQTAGTCELVELLPTMNHCFLSRNSYFECTVKLCEIIAAVEVSRAK